MVDAPSMTVSPHTRLQNDLKCEIIVSEAFEEGQNAHPSAHESSQTDFNAVRAKAGADKASAGEKECMIGVGDCGVRVVTRLSQRKQTVRVKVSFY